jgi:hypothetical protein
LQLTKQPMSKTRPRSSRSDESIRWRMATLHFTKDGHPFDRSPVPQLRLRSTHGTPKMKDNPGSNPPIGPAPRPDYRHKTNTSATPKPRPTRSSNCQTLTASAIAFLFFYFSPQFRKCFYLTLYSTAPKTVNYSDSTVNTN